MLLHINIYIWLNSILNSRPNSLKHVQHFDRHSLIKRKKTRKKDGNSQFTNFRPTCNIAKPFELARGKFTDIGYNYN